MICNNYRSRPTTKKLDINRSIIEIALALSIITKLKFIFLIQIQALAIIVIILFKFHVVLFFSHVFCIPRINIFYHVKLCSNNRLMLL